MQKVATFTVSVLLCAEQAYAYGSSESECKKFAALWSGTCGDTDDDAVYSITDWHLNGAGALNRNCFASTDVLSPETGNKAKSYSSFARNCITCRKTGGETRIRYQSNNIPKICFAANKSNTERYPKSQKIDMEVTWNKDVLRKTNVSDDKAATAATTSALLCDYTFS